SDLLSSLLPAPTLSSAPPLSSPCFIFSIPLSVSLPLSFTLSSAEQRTANASFSVMCEDIGIALNITSFLPTSLPPSFIPSLALYPPLDDITTHIFSSTIPHSLPHSSSP